MFPMTITDRTKVERAFALASDWHVNQKRKQSIIVDGTPYLSHVMEVAAMVMAVGGDADTVAAALLHDSFEDQGMDKAPYVAKACGFTVVQLIQECTEPETGRADDTKGDWQSRKVGYLTHINNASYRALLIMLADKLHDMRDIRYTYWSVGNLQPIEAFGGGYAGQAWFFQNFIYVTKQRLHTMPLQEINLPVIGAQCLLRELELVVDEIFPYQNRRYTC